MDLKGIDVASANIVWKMCLDDADTCKNSDSLPLHLQTWIKRVQRSEANNFSECLTPN